MKSYPYAECQLCRSRMLPPYKGCGSCHFGSNYNPVEIESRSVVGMYHTSTLMPPIRRVIFNDPATIVFWVDGTKTVVKAYNEVFDPEKGLAMAIAKKAMGNGGYYPEIKRWTEKYYQNQKKFEEAMDRVADISRTTANDMVGVCHSEITMSEEEDEEIVQQLDSEGTNRARRIAETIQNNLGCDFFYTRPRFDDEEGE